MKYITYWQVMNGDIPSVTAEQDETDYNQNGGR
jgi:hypothetical protein